MLPGCPCQRPIGLSPPVLDILPNRCTQIRSCAENRSRHSHTSTCRHTDTRTCRERQRKWGERRYRQISNSISYFVLHEILDRSRGTVATRIGEARRVGTGSEGAKGCSVRWGVEAFSVAVQSGVNDEHLFYELLARLSFASESLATTAKFTTTAINRSGGWWCSRRRTSPANSRRAEPAKVGDPEGLMPAASKQASQQASKQVIYIYM